MPFQAMTEENLEKALTTMHPDLRFIFEENSLAPLSQAHLGELCKDVPRFKNFFEDRADLKQSLKTDFGVDAAAGGLADRTEIAAIIAAWEAAGEWKKTQDKNAAEDAALGRPPVIKMKDFNSAKKSLELIYGKQEEEYVPAPALVELKEHEMNELDFSADTLDEVPSILECKGDMDLEPVLSKQGQMKFRKVQKLKNAPPKDPESLRHRLTLLGNTFSLLKLRHTSHKVVSTADQDMWDHYAKYLLGPKVKGLPIKNENGEVVGAVSWVLILSYDYEVRKEMCRLMNEQGFDIKAALKKAYSDGDLRQLYFLTPMAVSVNVPTADNQADRGGNGKGMKRKQPGYDDSRQKSPGALPAGLLKDLHTKTEDKEDICFGFNNPGERCTTTNCPRWHICRFCRDKADDKRHPFYMCPEWKRTHKEESEALSKARSGGKIAKGKGKGRNKGKK